MDNKDFELIGKLQVRIANEDDAAHLQTYCFPDQTEEKVAEELKSDLSDGNSTIRLVADASGYAVGHISVEQHPTKQGIGQICNLAVSGPFRLLGVADHLIAAAESAAKDEGLNSLEIELNATDNPVIQRYKDWGFAEKPIVILEKPISDDEVEPESVDDVPDEETDIQEQDAPEAEQQSLLAEN
ncbi:GNAT family N-acetyltransferase [Candidatus Poribacteria bacterium]|nr:GNAT family N-acetyltransferase [Candidatus Poribacteria bacterium]